MPEGFLELWALAYIVVLFVASVGVCVLDRVQRRRRAQLLRQTGRRRVR